MDIYTWISEGPVDPQQHLPPAFCQGRIADTHLSIHLSIDLSVHIRIHLSIYPSIHLYIYVQHLPSAISKGRIAELQVHLRLVGIEGEVDAE